MTELSSDIHWRDGGGRTSTLVASGASKTRSLLSLIVPKAIIRKMLLFLLLVVAGVPVQFASGQKTIDDNEKVFEKFWILLHAVSPSTLLNFSLS